jgi:hypothetical protein
MAVETPGRRKHPKVARLLPASCPARRGADRVGRGITPLRHPWGFSRVQQLSRLQVKALRIEICTLASLMVLKSRCAKRRILQGSGGSPWPTVQRLVVDMVPSCPCSLDYGTMTSLVPDHLRMSLCLPVMLWRKTPLMLVGTPLGYRWKHQGGLSPRLLPANISAAEAPGREEVGHSAGAAHSRLAMSPHQVPDSLLYTYTAHRRDHSATAVFLPQPTRTPLQPLSPAGSPCRPPRPHPHRDAQRPRQLPHQRRSPRLSRWQRRSRYTAYSSVLVSCRSAAEHIAGTQYRQPEIGQTACRLQGAPSRSAQLAAKCKHRAKSSERGIPSTSSTCPTTSYRDGAGVTCRHPPGHCATYG